MIPCPCTWAIPHPSKPFVYITGNGSNEILEVDREKWEVSRKFEAGKAPYNVEITPDGKLLVATYKGEGATGIWNIKKGKEVGKVKPGTILGQTYTLISIEEKSTTDNQIMLLLSIKKRTPF